MDRALGAPSGGPGEAARSVRLGGLRRCPARERRAGGGKLVRSEVARAVHRVMDPTFLHRVIDAQKAPSKWMESSICRRDGMAPSVPCPAAHATLCQLRPPSGPTQTLRQPSVVWSGPGRWSQPSARDRSKEAVTAAIQYKVHLVGMAGDLP